MAQKGRIADQASSRDARRQPGESGRRTPGLPGPDHPLLSMQQIAGNAAVTRLVEPVAATAPGTVQRHMSPATYNRGSQAAGDVMVNALLVGNQGLELQNIGGKLQSLERSLMANAADATVSTVEAHVYNAPLGGQTAPASGSPPSSSGATGTGGGPISAYTPSVATAIEGG